jgi:hypothetical protein
MVRSEWNTYTLGRYSEQPDATKLKATVVQYEKDRVVTQSDYDKLKATTKLTDGTNEISTIYDYKSGKTSLIVSRAAGKITFTEEYGSNQANQAIITPASGKKICVGGVLTAIDADAGDISLDFLTSGKKVWRHYGAKFKTQCGKDIHIDGAVDESLTLNSTQGANDIFLLVNYREVD